MLYQFQLEIVFRLVVFCWWCLLCLWYFNSDLCFISKTSCHWLFSQCCALQMQVYVFQRGPPEMGRSSCDALVYNSVMYIQLPRLLREDSKSSSRCCKQPKKVVESWLCFYGVCVPEPTLSYSLGFSISSSHIIDFHQEAPFCFLC